MSCCFSTHSPGATAYLRAEVGSSALSVLCSAWAAPKSAPQLLQLVMQLCKESCHLFLSDDLSGNAASTVPMYIQGSSQQGKKFYFTVFNSLPVGELFLLWLLHTTLLMFCWSKDTCKIRFVADLFEESVCQKKALLRYP